jgi:hypothetical protein
LVWRRERETAGVEKRGGVHRVGERARFKCLRVKFAGRCLVR